MALPAWVTIADADVSVGAFLKETVVMKPLRDNAAALRTDLYPVNIAETTTTGAAYGTVTGSEHKVFVRNLADYVGIDRKIRLEVEARATSGEGRIRLYDVGSSTAGVEVVFTNTSYAWKSLELDVADGWKGTVRDLRVEFYRSSGAGTIYARAVNAITGRVEF
jgi:hypothetical protein